MVILDAGMYSAGASVSIPGVYVHKVKRVEKGVVAYARLNGKFAIGDTILYRY